MNRNLIRCIGSLFMRVILDRYGDSLPEMLGRTKRGFSRIQFGFCVQGDPRCRRLECFRGGFDCQNGRFEFNFCVGTGCPTVTVNQNISKTTLIENRSFRKFSTQKHTWRPITSGFTRSQQQFVYLKWICFFRRLSNTIGAIPIYYIFLVIGIFSFKYFVHNAGNA